MAKVEKTDNKDQKLDKSTKKVVKSSYSKKKKTKKNILNGIAYVQSTFNNTIISIADTNGNVVSWASAGQKGFKGSRKSTPYAAQVAASADSSRARRCAEFAPGQRGRHAVVPGVPQPHPERCGGHATGGNLADCHEGDRTGCDGGLHRFRFWHDGGTTRTRLHRHAEHHQRKWRRPRLGDRGEGGGSPRRAGGRAIRAERRHRGGAAVSDLVLGRTVGVPCVQLKLFAIDTPSLQYTVGVSLMARASHVVDHPVLGPSLE